MPKKSLPCPQKKLEEISQQYGTPFYLYSEKEIHHRATLLRKAFDCFTGFQEFFAIKATPTPKIMELFRDYGFGMDASSIAELVLCEKLGITGENIMFSSNGTKPEEFRKAQEMGAIINVDDISLLDNLSASGCSFPELICFRINPGNKKTGNTIIGNPVDAKFGITLDQVIPAYKKAKALGAKRFGIHTMTGSNILDEHYFPETTTLLTDIAKELKSELDIDLEFINIGGGFGIPYREEEEELNIENIAKNIQKIFINAFPEHQPKLFMEIGRWLTGPTGWLISKVVSRKDIYKKYVVLDSSMADLMRPGMYNAYHHISIANDEKKTEIVDVVGSLCENNDKFAIDRELPVSKQGDLVVIHDTGAHGRAMGFNYNGKLRAQEILLRTDGTTQRIRRPETLEDYFSTLIF